MVLNCSTESPSTYDASAPAASSYTRPQAATTNTLMSRVISMGRGRPVRSGAASNQTGARGYETDFAAGRHQGELAPFGGAATRVSGGA